MKKHWQILVFVLLAVAWLCGSGIAQFTPEEIAQREYWEEFLSTAKIIKSRQMSRRRGITRPFVLVLEKDGQRKKAIWKPIEGLHKGFAESWRWEIAAYRLDKYLGLNMIPPTVERVYLHKRGSLQLWVKAKTGLRDKDIARMALLSENSLGWNRSMFLQRAFDNLIANEDRHLGNYLITKDGRILLIDHSRSFRISKQFTSTLIFNENHRDGNKIMRQIPLAFFSKIKNFDFELLKDITGQYLTDIEIEAVLMRRDLVLEEIDRIVGEYGYSDVLY